MEPEKIERYGDAVEDAAEVGLGILARAGHNLIGLARGIGFGWLLFLTLVSGRQLWVNQDRIAAFMAGAVEANPVAGLPWDELDRVDFPVSKHPEIHKTLKQVLYDTGADKAALIVYQKGSRVIADTASPSETATIPRAFWHVSAIAPGYQEERLAHLRRDCYETRPELLPENSYFRYALETSEAGYYLSCPYDGVGFIAVSFSEARGIQKASESHKRILSEAIFRVAELLKWRKIPGGPYDPPAVIGD